MPTDAEHEQVSAGKGPLTDPHHKMRAPVPPREGSSKVGLGRSGKHPIARLSQASTWGRQRRFHGRWSAFRPEPCALARSTNGFIRARGAAASGISRKGAGCVRGPPSYGLRRRLCLWSAASGNRVRDALPRHPRRALSSHPSASLRGNLGLVNSRAHFRDTAGMTREPGCAELPDESSPSKRSYSWWHERRDPDSARKAPRGNQVASVLGPMPRPA
jgi:hypothetical protein